MAVAEISKYIDAAIEEGQVEDDPATDDFEKLSAVGMAKDDYDHFMESHAAKVFNTACALGEPVTDPLAALVAELIDRKPPAVAVVLSRETLAAICFAMLCYGIDAKARMHADGPKAA